MTETALENFVKLDVARIRGGESTPLLEGIEKSMFLEDYRKYSEVHGYKWGGEYDANVAFAEEFIDHPEKFRTTERAVKLAYSEFVYKPAGISCSPYEVGGTEFPMVADALRNVEVKVDYRHLSVRGGNAAILETLAEVRQPDGSYNEMRFDGACGNLRDWIERIPDEELEQLKQG